MGLDKMGVPEYKYIQPTQTKIQSSTNAQPTLNYCSPNKSLKVEAQLLSMRNVNIQLNFNQLSVS